MLARDEETGVSGAFPVTAQMARTSPEVIWLTLAGGERIGLTSEHPLFVVGKGWTLADAVVPGDALRTASLGEIAVLGVEVEARAQPVFNLEVAGAETYFVGDAAVWGHNANPCDRFSDEKQALVEMAKLDKARGGITERDLDAYKKLNSGLPDPFPENKVRGPEQHHGRGFGPRKHCHVGPVNHILVK